MDKKAFAEKMTDIASTLDKLEMFKEADVLDGIMRKVAVGKTEGVYDGGNLEIGDTEYTFKIGYAVTPGEAQTMDYPGSPPYLETWLIEDSIQPQAASEVQQNAIVQAIETELNTKDRFEDAIWDQVREQDEVAQSMHGEY
jgi:hypothetical protein